MRKIIAWTLVVLASVFLITFLVIMPLWLGFALGLWATAITIGAIVGGVGLMVGVIWAFAVVFE